MKQTTWVAVLGMVATLALAPASAEALSFTVDNVHLVEVGGSVDFNATLTASPGDPDPLQLLGIGVTLAGPGFTIDDSPFFVSWPLQLDSSNPGVSDAFSGPLFTVLAGAGVVPPGPYAGSVTLTLAGDEPDSEFEVTRSFEVLVRRGVPPPVPEPMTMGLLGLGLAGVALRRVRR